jgi:hypothetical protein
MEPWWIKRKPKRNLIDELQRIRDKHQKFYQSQQWRRLRLQKLTIDPLCEMCLKGNGAVSGQSLTVIATEVDHIIPLIERYDLRLSFDNLQSLDEEIQTGILS